MSRDRFRSGKTGVITSVCHSLRYHKAFLKLKDLVASGRLGPLITIEHIEQVAWWHQAHSFVRGNWRNEAQSAYMLLAKSCHDLDYLSFLVEAPCRAVSSFGALTHFTRAHAPAGSGEGCTACAIEPDCAYSAIRQYMAHRLFLEHLTTDQTEQGPVLWTDNCWAQTRISSPSFPGQDERGQTICHMPFRDAEDAVGRKGRRGA